MSTIAVRSPIIDDLNSIVNINRKALPENYSVSHFIELIRKWQNYSSVGVLDGQVVAYLILRLESQRSFFSRSSNYSKGHIISVATIQEARRKGIANLMMQDAMEKARAYGGIESIELEVRESNEPAIKLYEKFGFIKSKVLYGYYADGENALLMTVNL